MYKEREIVVAERSLLRQGPAGGCKIVSVGKNGRAEEAANAVATLNGSTFEGSKTTDCSIRHPQGIDRGTPKE